MDNVKETSSTLGFAVPVFFERTERIRERIVDCNREELIDLSFHYLGKLEKIQGMLQATNDDLESFLGYHEQLKK